MIQIPDFQFVQSPVFTPTSCATCMSHRDTKGFVDLQVDTPVNGRLYICATCLEQGGRKIGMLPKDESERLKKQNAQLKADLAASYKSLEEAKENRTLSLADVRKLLKSA